MNTIKAPKLVICLPIETVDGTPVAKQREMINSLAALAHSDTMENMGIVLTSPILCEDSNERFSYMFNDHYLGHTTILENGLYYAPAHQRYIEIMAFLRSRNWPHIDWMAFDSQTEQYPEKCQGNVHSPTGENIQKQVLRYIEKTMQKDSSHVA